MAEARGQIKFTVEDYLNLPESETKRYELIGGDLIMIPAPNWLHQSLAAELFERLNRFVKEQGLGEVHFAPLDLEHFQHDGASPAWRSLSPRSSPWLKSGA